ncbi:Arb2 domain-containing protein [Stachybotrys elegans]|uniref:Autophagy-related protein 29 n=1 Tax=Stachybotrys elegans TaxID=80388 RepID=A0A8K0SQ11_9HYPO|nr:Arb2 domain-containing protein [Stachybotrys elegans]
MTEPQYTVFLRVPIPRGSFVDPPEVDWDSAKDDALWRILSGAAQKEIDCRARDFNVPVDFLLHQVAYLTERHASQVRAQVRKATAAARGSAAPSPVPGTDSAGMGHARTPSALSIRRDSPLPRTEAIGSGSSFNTSRPLMSRNTSGGTTILREVASSSPRPGKTGAGRLMEQTGGRRRLSSLPITSNAAVSPEREAPQEPERSPSPGPVESSSASSEDDSLPAQSRIIRRPPRFQQQEPGASPIDEDEDESEPAFQPYKPLSSKTSGPDLGSTLRGDGRGHSRRSKPGREALHYSQTSDSSSSSAAVVKRPSGSKDPRNAGPLSPRRVSEFAANSPSANSPSGRSKGYSREGSDGTPSMGSSFSDLDGTQYRISLSPNLCTALFFFLFLFFSFTMFRRHWSGLPADPMFPDDLKGLGYFVNDEDEIRSLEDPNLYFKFFINRNSRVNDRQRFHFDHAVEAVVHERLEQEGLVKAHLPQSSHASEPHIPILVSADLEAKTRVVVVIGESTDELGVLARRVVGGPGGISKGSVVSIVRALKQQTCSGEDKSCPGVVIANPAQTYWWPEGKRAITISASAALPQSSMAHRGRRYMPNLNDIPQNENSDKHIQCLFDQVLGSLSKHVKIDIIAIGSSCESMLKFFENKPNWDTWGHRLNAAVMVGSVYPTTYLTNNHFSDFLAKRARGYIISPEPLGTPLAPPTGNENEAIPPLGFPCYSSSEPHVTELILIHAAGPALQYLQDVAVTPNYENDTFEVFQRPQIDVQVPEWDDVPSEEKPLVSKVDPEWLEREIKQNRAWDKFVRTGVAPLPDSDESDDE